MLVLFSVLLIFGSGEYVTGLLAVEVSESSRADVEVQMTLSDPVTSASRGWAHSVWVIGWFFCALHKHAWYLFILVPDLVEYYIRLIFWTFGKKLQPKTTHNSSKIFKKTQKPPTRLEFNCRSSVKTHNFLRYLGYPKISGFTKPFLLPYLHTFDIICELLKALKIKMISWVCSWKTKFFMSLRRIF